MENALDLDITERDFWDMTLIELERVMASKKRQLIQKQQETASFHYILADLIGKSVSRIYNSANTLPTIQEVYPTLFDSQEIEQKKIEKKAELSALRFKQFAQSYNKKFNKEVLTKSNERTT